MKDRIYLVLNKNKIVRTAKNPPPLFMGEVAVKLNLGISDDWFRKVIPEGTVSIPDTAVLGDGLEIVFKDMTSDQLGDIDNQVTIEIERRKVSPKFTSRTGQ